MPHQGEKQQRPAEENKKLRPEEQFVPEERSFGMPNSFSMSMPATPPGTPNSVMREMDPEDSGGLFRNRGFDPSVGAHELSHTVRRETVSSPVFMSVPSGTIQRNPTKKGSGKSAGAPAAAAAAEPEAEEESPAQLGASINSLLAGARNLNQVFQWHRLGWEIDYLGRLMSTERNPNVLRSMDYLKRKLESVPGIFEEVRKSLTAAREQLRSGSADLSSIRAAVAEATGRMTLANSIYRELDHFSTHRDMFDRQRRHDEEVEEEAASFEVLQPGPAAQPAAAAPPVQAAAPAPPVPEGPPPSYAESWGTPGAAAAPHAPAAAAGLPSYDQSVETPGADEEPDALAGPQITYIPLPESGAPGGSSAQPKKKPEEKEP